MGHFWERGSLEACLWRRCVDSFSSTVPSSWTPWSKQPSYTILFHHDVSTLTKHNGARKSWLETVSQKWIFLAWSSLLQFFFLPQQWKAMNMLLLLGIFLFPASVPIVLNASVYVHKHCLWTFLFLTLAFKPCLKTNMVCIKCSSSPNANLTQKSLINDNVNWPIALLLIFLHGQNKFNTQFSTQNMLPLVTRRCVGFSRRSKQHSSWTADEFLEMQLKFNTTWKYSCFLPTFQGLDSIRLVSIQMPFTSLGHEGLRSFLKPDYILGVFKTPSIGVTHCAKIYPFIIEGIVQDTDGSADRTAT